MLKLLCALLFVWLSSGCLKLTLYNASVTKPSQVAVYFSLTDSGGNPDRSASRGGSQWLGGKWWC